MNTFENLEQLNVSEKCFKEITNVISTLLEEWEITLDDLIKYDKENPPKSYEDTMKEWNKEYKKNTTKNQRGEFNTKKKQFPKSYKELGNAYGEPDKAEVEAERAERRSIARHKKKTGIIECFENILNMMESILNETSPEVRQSLISGRTNRATDADMRAKTAEATFRIAQSKAHSDLKDSGRGSELRNNMEQTARESRAEKAKLKRAVALADRLNRRVQTDNGLKNK